MFLLLSKHRRSTNFIHCNSWKNARQSSNFRQNGIQAQVQAQALVNQETQVVESVLDEREFVVVGYICNVHGLRGELRVHPSTDFPEERFVKATMQRQTANRLSGVQFPESLRAATLKPQCNHRLPTELCEFNSCGCTHDREYKLPTSGQKFNSHGAVKVHTQYGTQSANRCSQLEFLSSVQMHAEYRPQCNCGTLVGGHELNFYTASSATMQHILPTSSQKLDSCGVVKCTPQELPMEPHTANQLSVVRILITVELFKCTHNIGLNASAGRELCWLGV
eukprot:Gb_18216 [translate_table: standard]